MRLNTKLAFVMNAFTCESNFNSLSRGHLELPGAVGHLRIAGRKAWTGHRAPGVVQLAPASAPLGGGRVGDVVAASEHVGGDGVPQPEVSSAREYRGGQVVATEG